MREQWAIIPLIMHNISSVYCLKGPKQSPIFILESFRLAIVASWSQRCPVLLGGCGWTCPLPCLGFSGAQQFRRRERGATRWSAKIYHLHSG